MKKQKNTYFWTSYSDLMTSLFFIMLVLFALTTIMLKKKNDATERELENIRKVEASTEDLKGEYFEYRKDYEKFILKVKCNFPVAQYSLKNIVLINICLLLKDKHHMIVINLHGVTMN